MAEPIRLDTVVERVDVYRTEALVTRRGVAALGGMSGRVGLEFVNLPLALRDDSLRLAIGEPDAARLVDLHLGWAPALREGRLRTEAAEELRGLFRQRVELEVERDRERARLAFLESLQPQVLEATELPENLAFAQRHQTDALLALAGWVGEQLTATRSRVRGLGRDRRSLLDRIAEARDALDKESQAELEALAVLRKLARVELDLAGPVDELPLRLSYLVPGARWVPEYELRVFEERDEAELVLKALVAQRTGEAWDRAELAFSTADLTRSAELPELSSWRIGKVQPPSSTGWRPLPEGLEDLFEAFDQHRGQVPAPSMPAAPGLPEGPRLGKAPSERDTKPKKAPKDVSEIITAATVRMATPAPQPAPGGMPQAVSGMVSLEEGGVDGFSANLAAEIECADMDEEMAMPCEEPAPMAPPAPPAQMSASRAMPSPKVKRRARGGRKEKKKAMLRDAAKEVQAASFGAGAVMDDLVEHNIEAEPAGLDASAEALGYQALRMQGPEDSLRGQLKAASPAERMLDSLTDASDELRKTVRRVPSAAWRDLLGAGAGRLGDLNLPRHAVQVEHSAGHFAVRYPMESLGSIPPDGQLHACTLLRRTGSARRIFRCVPLLDDHVYQIVEFKNPLELPLLAGPVRAYRGGDYVVTAPLMTTPPGKTLTVNLGVEQNIAVARNLHFSESTEGLFGGDTALIHKVEIEVRSRLGRDVRVEVFERLPVSDDDDVKVELIKATPDTTEYEQTERGRPISGGRRFAFDLKARAVVTCKLEYRITIPSKRVLVGGNRRD